MKTLMKLLSLYPITFSCVGCGPSEEKPKIDVVIISGQSNAVGCTFSNCLNIDDYFDYNDGYPGIKIAYDCWTKDFEPTRFYSQNSSNGEFVKVKLGQGNFSGTFGPEIGISKKLSTTHSNKLFLIKYACGASNLKDDWAMRDSPMYNRFINYVKDRINDLKEMGYDPTIKAFCWMQGEGDSYDGYYQYYYTNIKQFVTNVRSDLKDLSGNKDVPFIDAGISDASPWVYYSEVNNAKKQFADESENNIYIDTIAAGLHTNLEPSFEPDLCHYDTESQIQLGQLFAEAFEQYLD